MERAIRYLRSSFFAGRHFADLRDVREQFARWRDDIAHARKCPQDETMTVAEALAAERARLLALPEHPFETTDVRAVVARKQPYVTYDTNRYSVPHDVVGVALTLVADEKQIRVLDGDELVASHTRSWLKKQIVEDPAHIAALVEHKRRGKELKGRELVIAQVPQAEALYARLLDAHERPQRHTTKLLKLIEYHGAEVVRTAVDLAIERGTAHADGVEYLIEKHHRQTRKPDLQPRWGRPEIDELRITHHTLEDYDDLSNSDH